MCCAENDGLASEKSFDPDSGSGLASEKSFDPDSAGFVGDASLSEKSYDPDSAGFLGSEKSGSDDDKSFDASEDSFDPDNVPDDDDATSAASFDPEKADGGLASEKSFDPDREEDDEQDLSGFDEQEQKNVATISAAIAQKAMANLHSTANVELTKLRSQVTELTAAQALLKGYLKDSEEAKGKLNTTYHSLVVEAAQSRDTLTAQVADVTGDLTHATASCAALQKELDTLNTNLADAHAQGKEQQVSLANASESLQKESHYLAAEKDKAAKAAAAAAAQADALKLQLAQLSQSNTSLEAQLKDLTQSLRGESEEKGKVAHDKANLQHEVEASKSQYQQLLATVTQWVAWRVSMTEEVAKLKVAQSELLTAIDPALEAKLAVLAVPLTTSPQHSGKTPKATLEGLPSAIAAAMRDDDDVTQGVEDMVSTLRTMATMGKTALVKTLSDNEESITDLTVDLEAKTVELGTKSKELEAARRDVSSSTAAGAEALRAEQEAHTLLKASTSTSLEALQKNLDTQVAALGSTKEELAAAGNTRDVLEKELQQTKTCVASLEAQVAELEDVRQSLHKTGATLEKAVREEQTKLTICQTQEQEAQSMAAKVGKQLQEIQGQLDAANKAAEDSLASLGGEAAHLAGEIEKLKAVGKEVAAERDSLQDKLQTVSTAKAALDEQVQTHVAAHAALAETSQQTHTALKTAEKHAKEGVDKICVLEGELQTIAALLDSSKNHGEALELAAEEHAQNSEEAQRVAHDAAATAKEHIKTLERQVCMCIYICANVNMCMYMYIHIHTYINVYICLCIYIYTYVICICIYMYIYI